MFPKTINKFTKIAINYIPILTICYSFYMIYSCVYKSGFYYKGDLPINHENVIKKYAQSLFMKFGNLTCKILSFYNFNWFF